MSLNKYIGFQQMKQISQNDQPKAQVNQMFSILNLLDYSHLNAQDSTRIVENLKEIEVKQPSNSFPHFCEKLFNTINRQKPEFIDQLKNDAKALPDNTLAKMLSDNLSSLRERNFIQESVSDISTAPKVKPRTH